jgi:hypothetical protein
VLALWCGRGGNLAGGQHREPGQGFPVKHIGPFPFGGQFPAPLIELVTQELDLAP